ncbi:hypothetical protein F8O07_00635 [Pseudoclavibacter sp. CFCC 13796]|uniref:hypothetical protein n=1 Tax=Pseudoclavibacter sp. CFCC 13796 TaxID=2615179 RepID=UPI001300D0F7|nr:hypothetical protein [Pseudoclavibacter sp. CFCC 13796]KAB1660534.1 hypothetical protein F8O07_00635 [Pseudoclavibacter sp. CFCC 13796]
MSLLHRRRVRALQQQPWRPVDTTTVTTVANLVDRFTERKRQDTDTAQATIGSYDSVAGVITGPDGCGEPTLLEVRPGRIVKWLRSTATSRGAGIAKTARSVLSGASDIAIEDGALNQNPMRMLPKMKRPRPAGAQAIPPGEVPALRTAIATNKLVAERDLTDLLLLLLLATGLRVGEACALRWDEHRPRRRDAHSGRYTRPRARRGHDLTRPTRAAAQSPCQPTP